MGFLLFLWVAFAALGSYIGCEKNRGSVEGFWLGMLFGPLGVIVEALLPTLAAPKPVPVPAPRPTVVIPPAPKPKPTGPTPTELRAAERERAERHARQGEMWEDFFTFGWFRRMPALAQAMLCGLVVAGPVVWVLVKTMS